MMQVRRPLLRLAWLAGLPLLLATAFLLATPGPADAATITVTGTGNSLASDQICTLIEALINANQDLLLHGDCLVAGSGADTIRFQIPTFQDTGCNLTTRVCTIVTDATYNINGPITIDGYTQTNTSPNSLAVGNNAVIRIRLIPANSSVPTALRIAANDVTIRGLAIGGYAEYGIHVESAARATIIGCFIGTNAAGTAAEPNGLAGIRLDVASSNARIGGTSPADRNVISGNATFLGTQAGILIAGASGTVIQGNYIGVKANGSEALPNVTGIDIQGASVNTIGGTTAGAGNVISGNAGRGIVVADAGSIAFANLILGNAIGYNAAGTGFIGNGSQGIRLAGAENSFIGDDVPGAGNRIGGNSGAGILILSGTGNRILRNGIVGNSGLGIDLGGDGVTPTDAQDTDTGPNNLQNFPDLHSVGVRVNTTVHGFLHSTPSRQFRIDFYSNTACDSSGYGEGETFLGFADVTTDDTGNRSFVWTHPQPVQAGTFITATATDQSTKNTSEFSACRQAVTAAFIITPASGPTTEAHDNPTWDAGFGVSPSSRPTANVTIPLLVSDATEGAIVGPTSVTMTPFDIPAVRTVSLVGVDDGIDDGNVAYTVVLGPATSADPNYNGLNPSDVAVTNVDNDDAALQCGPRPKVNVSVTKIAPGQLRATVTVGANPGNQNEIQGIGWAKLTTAAVVVDSVGPVQAGQSTFFGPLTQTASFVITRTPGASSATVELTVVDACGPWPTVVGGGPNAW